MTTKKRTTWIFTAALTLILAACSLSQPPGAPAADTAPSPLANLPPMVSAAGEIVPEQTALLSIKTGGVVAEVLVEEGDPVDEGQVLVRLEGTEQLQAAVAAAKFELVNAQFALDTLYENTELMAAQALQSQEEYEEQLEELLAFDVQQAGVLKAISDANKSIDTFSRNYRSQQNTANQYDIDAAKAQVILAKDKFDDAIEDFEEYEDKNEDNLQRANYLSKKAAAEKAYEDAVRRLNNLSGTGREVDIDAEEGKLIMAQAQLSQAEREWERIKDGPNPGDVAVLEALISDAQKDHEIYSQGPDPEDVALAEARIENAIAQLTAAEAALADLELAAPFTGIISEIHINSSEWVAPGQPVLLLADLNHLRVETTDLGEIDVAQIALGDVAEVTFDSLPDLAIPGVVTSIAPKASAGSGVNYTVVLELDEVPEQLRWGMTAYVDIDLEK
ncbi:MAG: efflux RND transporter periplasmic adaptor subunit [Anaerolineales bacterium]|nr:efflux RND transporter periplasmic adaptor subunit [Anaerolineales bacterium]